MGMLLAPAVMNGADTSTGLASNGLPLPPSLLDMMKKQGMLGADAQEEEQALAPVSGKRVQLLQEIEEAEASGAATDGVSPELRLKLLKLQAARDNLARAEQTKMEFEAADELELEEKAAAVTAAVAAEEIKRRRARAAPSAPPEIAHPEAWTKWLGNLHTRGFFKGAGEIGSAEYKARYGKASAAFSAKLRKAASSPAKEGNVPAEPQASTTDSSGLSVVEGAGAAAFRRAAAEENVPPAKSRPIDSVLAALSKGRGGGAGAPGKGSREGAQNPKVAALSTAEREKAMQAMTATAAKLKTLRDGVSGWLARWAL
jgi:hypothetical protein